MAEENGGKKSGLVIPKSTSIISIETLSALSGVLMGNLSLLHNKIYGGENHGVFFICITIGIVGSLIAYSIKRAAAKIVAQLKE